MLPHRMAFKPFLSLALLWTTLSTVAIAQQSINIPSEVTSSVPNCARDCFRSFIVANFGSSGCGGSPSLQCLCTKTGASGYTLGEGAFSCAVAEANRGNCKGADAASGVSVGAYRMCDNVPNAASATHDTIVATLIIPSGSGGLAVPTPTSSGRSSSSSTSTSPTPTSSASEESTQGEAAATNQPGLSGPQIAGIALGVIAGVVAFGVFLIILARCIRRKRFGPQDPEAGFSKMRDSWSFGRGSNHGSPPARYGDRQISNPIHKTPVEMDFQRPVQPAYEQFGAMPTEMQQPAEPIHPAMIGLAISPQRTIPARSNSAATNPPTFSSVPSIGGPPPTMVFTPPSLAGTPVNRVGQSPPKPALTLAIPKGRAPLAGGGGGAARDSVVTEFAEDGEGESNPNTGNIWRPPASDPQSALTYYFADKGGNWILRNPSTTKKTAGNLGPVSPQIELPSPEDKTRAERAQGFSPIAPLRVPGSRARQQKLGSPIAFKDQSRGVNRSSSIYTSNNGPRSAASPATGPMGGAASVPPPETYFAMIKDGRSLTGPRPKPQRRSSRRASRRVSHQSSTSIESGGGPFEDEECIIGEEPQISLTPVAQSPNSPAQGRSPVTYPKIPSRSKTAPGLSLFPAPSRDNSVSPRGQTSPAVGAGIPMKTTRAATNPAQIPGPTNNKRTLYLGGLPVNPHPNRNPGQVKTGSPEFRMMGAPSAPPTAELPSTPQGRRRVASPQPKPQTQGLGIAVERPQKTYQTPSPAHQQRQKQAQPQRYPSPPQLQQQPQPTVASTMVSSPAELGQGQGSSLLAKRLGADKAAALALGSGGDGGGGEPASLQQPKRGWTRESFAPGPSQPAAQRPQGPGIMVEGGYLPITMPGTPGWMPQLTPSRRGDDLYLDVR